jgi:hypothetical protein
LHGHADGGDMPKKEQDDKPVVLYPMTFEDALKRMLKTPPINPSKHKKGSKTFKKKTFSTSAPRLP